MAFFVFGEPLTLAMITGMGLAATGVYLVVRQP
jgi:drug/metabolite transporter (DMT)-like permease